MVKHSGWYGLSDHIQKTPNEYVLSVEDNGIGIANEGKVEPGSGLRGMRERLEFVNGSLHVEAEKGQSLQFAYP